jgi:hypothetical protein
VELTLAARMCVQAPQAGLAAALPAQFPMKPPEKLAAAGEARIVENEPVQGQIALLRDFVVVQ